MPIIEGETQETTQCTPASNQNEATLDSELDPRDAINARKRKAPFIITTCLRMHGLMCRINPYQRKHTEFLNMTQFAFDRTCDTFNFKISPHEEIKEAAQARV